MSSSLLSSSISKVSRALDSGSITASKLCDMCLERIESTKDMNAYITITTEVAQEQARKTEQRIKEGKRLGLLDGIPIAFKDNFSTSGIRTTCASKMLENYYSPFNATVVQKFLDQGMVMTGKTNMDEFAMGSGTVDSLFGPAKNPWRSGLKYKLLKKKNTSQNLAETYDSYEYPNLPLENEDFFICGGSSGGSAIAVATGCCFGALGSDTGGSTRSPAAICGVVGLKPTYGLVSRNGLIPLCNSLDVPGILARTVDDATLLLGCIAGCDEEDSTTSRRPFSPFTIPDELSVKNLHIGIPKEYECEGISAEVVDVWRKVADHFEMAGAKVSPVSLPHTKYSLMCYAVLCCCYVASNMARYDGIKFGYRADVDTSYKELLTATRNEGFGEVVRERILRGNYYLLKRNYEKYFVKAMQVRRDIYEDFLKVFDSGVDLLLTPVTLSDAVPYSHWMQMSNREHNASDDFCTQPVNMAGLPAISIPCCLSKNGLPLGLQLIGNAFKEETMLTAAKWLEQQMNFPIMDFQ